MPDTQTPSTAEAEPEPHDPGAPPEADPGGSNPPRPHPADAAGTLPGGAAYEPPARMSLQARLVLAALLLVALFALFWPRGDGSFEAPGGFLTDSAGRPETLGPRMRPVTLVHFWATWCPPCLTEVPSLNRMMEDFATYRDFDVLMVAVQDDVDKVETFLGAGAGRVLYDHGWDVAHRYGTRKLPETYLVVDGRVVKKWEGAQDWDDPELRQRVQQALDGEDPEAPDAADGAAGG